MSDELPIDQSGQESIKPETKEGETSKEAAHDHKPLPIPPLIGAHINPSQPESSQPKVKEKKPFPWKLLAECIGFAAGLGLLVINGCQLYEVHQTRLTDERAWVLVTGDITQQISDNKDSFVLLAEYKNTGKTPALNVECVISATNDKSGIPKEDPYPSLPEHQGICAPGQVQHIISATIPSQLMIDVANGRPFYLWGTIWYDDIFGKHHWSQFCFLVKRGQININLLQFNATQFHNSCDDAEANQTN